MRNRKDWNQRYESAAFDNDQDDSPRMWLCLMRKRPGRQGPYTWEQK